MGEIIAKVQGMDGRIELMADRVIITRPGLWNAMRFGLNSQREIPISAISEVDFKKASFITFGELEFVRSGRSSEERSKKNQSSVRFGRAQNKDFEAIKEKVFEMMEQYALTHHQSNNH